MSDEVKEEVKIGPLEVKIVNHPKDKKGDYDSVDDAMYDDLAITKEEVKEFEDGNTSD